MDDVTKEYINSAKVLAHVIGIEEKTIISLLGETYSTLYRKYYLPKKNGGNRLILEPIEPLKEVQKAMIPLFNKIEVSAITHSGIGRNIRTNAEPHILSKSMIGLDLKDAYGSASFSQYLYYFPKPWNYDFSKETIKLIQGLVDYQNYHTKGGRSFLPQGAPTSPAVFNLVCRVMDEKLAKFAKSVGGVVTRYADNITFSVEKKRIDYAVINAVERIATSTCFKINKDKTRIINDGNREGKPLRLPGVNIIGQNICLPRSTKRLLRLKDFMAGKTDNIDMHNGIRGHVLQVLEYWPHDLEGVFLKGNENKNVLILIP